MATGVRLIIAANQVDMISAIKSAFINNSHVESVVSVANPADAENKLNRMAVNVV